jgi:hypothetical protein
MTASPAPARVTHDGDTEPSCSQCRYFTGHTSWCPTGKIAAERAERPAVRVDLNTASAQRIAERVIGRTITVRVWAGWNEPRLTLVGRVERVENGRTVVRFPDGTWSYGPSGRITVH